MNLRISRSTKLAVGLLLPLAACGGEESTAEVRLMDAPPEGVSALNLFVAAMEVHVAEKGEPEEGAEEAPVEGEGTGGEGDEKGWETLTVGRSIDLVQHQGETAADVLGRLGLPEGKITQIRLIIDTTRPNTAVKDGLSCDLDVSKINPKGVKINHPFKAFESRSGSEHTIIVDVELDKSLTPNDGCFELKPVIKLHKVKTDGADVAI